LKNSIQIREVGLRDGLQLSKTKLSSEIKIKWCSLQSQAGFKEIEVTSFVPPSVLPQFSDASKIVYASNKINNLIPSVLVPNLKGALIALDNNSKKINFVLSASEMHNQSNVNSTIKKSLSMFKDFIKERNIRGLKNKVQISAAIATSFGCSIQGDVKKKNVIKICEKLLEMGAEELNIADTVGYANPNQVKEIFKSLNKISKNIPLAAHFHDTRGMGLANVISAIDEGVKRFDASLGGLGGCPYAPGASGNIATEDCVYMIESMGFSTGIDLKKLLKLRKSLKEWMKNDILYGNLLTSGFAKTFNI
tara:strand:- start:4339 stop:5259 length:921 start_codon:yes stop_codon:yes gene_type:complete